MGIAEEMMWSKKLGELEKILFNAQVIEPEEQDKRVAIGVGVVIEYEDGITAKFILDGYLIEPEENRVSFYSPLGRALLGAEEGEERELVIGGRKKIIFVKKIFLPSAAEKNPI